MKICHVKQTCSTVKHAELTVQNKVYFVTPAYKKIVVQLKTFS